MERTIEDELKSEVDQLRETVAELREQQDGLREAAAVIAEECKRLQAERDNVMHDLNEWIGKAHKAENERDAAVADATNEKSILGGICDYVGELVGVPEGRRHWPDAMGLAAQALVAELNALRASKPLAIEAKHPPGWFAKLLGEAITRDAAAKRKVGDLVRIAELRDGGMEIRIEDVPLVAPEALADMLAEMARAEIDGAASHDDLDERCFAEERSKALRKAEARVRAIAGR